MYETLEAIGQVAIGVAGFSGVIVFLQERDNVADFRLRSLISLAAEVIFFSFLPPLLSLVVAQEWKVAALIYAVVHAGQIVWSFVNYRGLDADRSAGYIPLDNVLMGIGALFSVALVACALLAPVNITQFGYTALLLWALGIAGVQFIRIVLRRRWNDGTLICRWNSGGLKMIAVEVHREIALPADVVWEEIRHFDRVLHWIPGGETSRINVRGEGVGAVRDIHLSTQGYVQHRLVEYDNSKRSFSYELTAGKPIGMQDYVVVASVVPLDAGRCTLSWSGRMSADSTLNEEAVGDALKVALSNMTTGIIARLSGEQPNFERQPNEDWQLRQQGVLSEAEMSWPR